MADEISAIGSGAGSDRISSMMNSGAGIDNISQTSSTSQVNSSIQGAEEGAEEGSVINQQDETELTDEAQGIAGAQAASESGAQNVDWDSTLKSSVQNVIAEEKQSSSTAAQTSTATAQQTSPIDQLKQDLQACKDAGGHVDANILSAAEAAVDGDIAKAEEILNNMNKQESASGANGANNAAAANAVDPTSATENANATPTESASGVKEPNVSNIVSGITNMFGVGGEQS